MWKNALENIKEFPSFIQALGISYKNEFKMIEKARNTPFQPVYEAFMNAWEALDASSRNQQHITISVYVDKDLLSAVDGVYRFNKIVVEDDGAGLNDENLKRLLTLRDDSKKNKNKGTGRVQYLHYFEETKIESVYLAEQGTYVYRQLTLSKKDAFVQNNAFVRFDAQRYAQVCKKYTRVTFSNPYSIDDAKSYASAEAANIKSYIVRNFISLLCDNRQSLPQIEIRRYVDGKLQKSKMIREDDIVAPESTLSFETHYVRVNQCGKLDSLSDKEKFSIRTFVMPQTMLGTNRMVLSSKGAEGQTITLTCMSSTAVFDGKHYLFMVSGDYVERCETDQRGNFRILTRKEVEDRGYTPLLDEKYITLDDIRGAAEDEVVKRYPTVKRFVEAKSRRIQELVNMFLLDQKRVDSLKNNISVNDSDEDILKKLYTEESKDIAKSDANLKAKFDQIGMLNPLDKNYEIELQRLSSEAMDEVPVSQKNELGKYVTRRKLVLDLLDLILQKKTEYLKDKETINEAYLHNLIFKKHSNDPQSSDLWLLNEEFIYFDGCSESRLVNIKIGDKPLFDESQLSENEIAKLNSGSRDRLKKRPDIFLYPNEGKCVLIEFKAPNVDVSEHIQQIYRYASLIRNYSSDEFCITKFYGYLIGEDIYDIDVRSADGDFIEAPHMEYWYRPNKTVAKLREGRIDGSLYLEITKYSTLLNRSKMRNKVFIKKLFGMKE